MAGVTVPVTTKILIGEVKVIADSEPFAHEKLSPLLAMYRAKNFEEAVDKAEQLVEMGVSVTPLVYIQTKITKLNVLITSASK